MINMKKIFALLLLISNSAFATNGDVLIGFGAKSRAMGGTGVATHLGAENALKNPAMAYIEEGSEFTFATTLFMPDVETENVTTGRGPQSSAANEFFIPSIGFVQNVGNNGSFGLGAYGVSGIGADFRGTEAADGLSKIGTSLSLIKFTPNYSHKFGDFKVGIGLPMLYGALGITFDTGSVRSSAGSSDDYGIGFDLGLAYTMSNFTFGLTYQSPIKMEYRFQLSESTTKFSLSGFTDELTQPGEIALGIAYEAANFLVTMDYRNIAWSSAEGYEGFGWDDQDVIALGGEFRIGGSSIRLGANFANNPLGDDAIKNTVTNQALNFLNLGGFPATIENHYTFGYGYEFSEKFSLDTAFVFAPEVEIDASFLGFNYTNKHSQTSFSLAGTWNF